MLIKQIELKNFRCFDHYVLQLDSPLVLLEGENGSGKTSILEALHYLCYIRSFRSYNARHLIRHTTDGFFIKALFQEDGMGLGPFEHALQIGFSAMRRVVKLDEKSIASYKELMEHYRVVSIAEHDLAIINEGPEIRRTFMDQAIMLSDPEYAKMVSHVRKIVEQRNSLLQQGAANVELYQLWTRQLWDKGILMQKARIDLLMHLEHEVNQLLATFFPTITPLAMRYKPKRDLRADSFEEFWDKNSNLYTQERAYGYCRVGPHLDDFHINWQGSSSKIYASRGQQKLLVLLLKIAHAQLITVQKGPVVLLIDDFLTDFDQKRAKTCLTLFERLNGQCIVTAPLDPGFLATSIHKMGGIRLQLTC